MFKNYIQKMKLFPEKKFNNPDFMCIGMQKAGTQWLFDQVNVHPDAWCPPIKEIPYLNDQIIKKKINKTYERVNQWLEKSDKQKIDLLFRTPNELDKSFCDKILKGNPSHKDGIVDLKWYLSLFEAETNDNYVIGDINPGYGVLPLKLIKKIYHYLPDLKIVLFIRDPVKRFWSQMVMHLRKGYDNYSENTLYDIDFLKNRSENKNVYLKSRLSLNYLPWSKVYGSNVQYYFMDELIENPVLFRESVFNFIGLDPEKGTDVIPASYNRKSKQKKYEMTPEVEKWIAVHFMSELIECSKIFGGRAKNWLNYYCDKYDI